MATDINLLPNEFKTSKEVLQTSRLVTRLAISFGSILVVGVLIGGGLLYYLSTQAEENQRKQEELLSNVKNLESSEHRLSLMKDRVDKITQVLNDRGEYELVDKYNSLLTQLPEGSFFEEIELDSDLSQITLVIPDSVALSTVLELVSDESKYTLVRVDSLEYSSVTGYEVVLDLL